MLKQQHECDAFGRRENSTWSSLTKPGSKGGVWFRVAALVPGLQFMLSALLPYWVSTQRVMNASGRLADDCMQKLQAAIFSSRVLSDDSSQTIWKRHFRAASGVARTTRRLCSATSLSFCSRSLGQSTTTLSRHAVQRITSATGSKSALSKIPMQQVGNDMLKEPEKRF
jgi:hypothetical protein